MFQTQELRDIISTAIVSSIGRGRGVRGRGRRGRARGNRGNNI